MLLPSRIQGPWSMCAKSECQFPSLHTVIPLQNQQLCVAVSNLSRPQGLLVRLVVQLLLRAPANGSAVPRVLGAELAEVLLRLLCVRLLRQADWTSLVQTRDHRPQAPSCLTTAAALASAATVSPFSAERTTPSTLKRDAPMRPPPPLDEQRHALPQQGPPRKGKCPQRYGSVRCAETVRAHAGPREARHRANSPDFQTWKRLEPKWLRSHMACVLFVRVSCRHLHPSCH